MMLYNDKKTEEKNSMCCFFRIICCTSQPCVNCAAYGEAFINSPLSVMFFQCFSVLHSNASHSLLLGSSLTGRSEWRLE